MRQREKVQEMLWGQQFLIKYCANKSLHPIADKSALGELFVLPSLRSGLTPGLSRCPFPPLRSGRTRGTKPTASRRLSPGVSKEWNMKKEIGNSSENQKVSAMVLKVAERYIDMGKTREERENYLRSASSAWNIACLPRLKRESSIKEYIDQYRKINKADPAECKALEEDLRLLIKQKDRLYPDVDVQIVNSRIDNIDGREHAIVVTARIN